MIFSGLFVLLLLILVENVIAKTLTSRIRKNIKKILTSWAGIDRVLRFIQYGSLIFISYYQQSSILMNDHVKLLMVANAYRLGRFSKVFSRMRKGLRFIRGGILFKRIKNTNLSITSSKSSATLEWTETLLLFLSDAADFTFYITDHYGVFYLLNIVQYSEILDIFSKLGDYMWIVCSLLAIPAYFIRLYRLNKYQKNEESLKSKKTLICIDIIRNMLEVVMGFFFVYESLAKKSTVGMVAIITTTLGLARFDFL